MVSSLATQAYVDADARGDDASSLSTIGGATDVQSLTLIQVHSELKHSNPQLEPAAYYDIVAPAPAPGLLVQVEDTNRRVSWTSNRSQCPLTT